MLKILIVILERSTTVTRIQTILLPFTVGQKSAMTDTQGPEKEIEKDGNERRSKFFLS